MAKMKPMLAWGIKQVGNSNLVEAAILDVLLVFTTRKAAWEEVQRYALAADVPECVVRVEIREVGRKG